MIKTQESAYRIIENILLSRLPGLDADRTQCSRLNALIPFIIIIILVGVTTVDPANKLFNHTFQIL